MQTTDVYLHATIGRPETLSCCTGPLTPGIFYGRITYLIAGLPVDVSFSELIRIAGRQLTCRPNPPGIYHHEFGSLASANRR